MKAIISNEYGPVEVLHYQETDPPVLADDELLVRVHACSVNPVDWKIRKGDAKLLTGRKPPVILGGDYAGVVAQAGKRVTNYAVGNRVWGMVNAFKGGTYAELVRVKEEEIGLMPGNLGFEEAASLPLVGLTAYQSLIYKGRLQRGDHVMVNGCSGGVGLAGVQIAKAKGCEVTGVCGTRNLELATKMGADHVLDYTKVNILKDKGVYDIFFDAVANQSFSRAKGTLKPRGAYVTTLPSFESMVLGPLINMISARKVQSILVKPSSGDLNTLKEMVEEGYLIPVVEEVYPLEKVREAHMRSETGRVTGKIVLRVD